MKRGQTSKTKDAVQETDDKPTRKCTRRERFRLWCKRWEPVIGVASLAVAVITIGVSSCQWTEDVIASNKAAQEQLENYQEEVRNWRREEERWQDEGAVYSLMRVTGLDEEADTVGDLGTGTSYRQLNSVLVISNTGRTQGTVIEIREASPDGEGVIMCVPSVTSDGRLNLESGITELPDTGGKTHTFGSDQVQTPDTENVVLTVGEQEVTLQPGESRLVILVGEPYDEDQESPVPYDGDYNVHTADGKTHRLFPKTAGSVKSEHYMSLPGLYSARSTCSHIAENYFEDE